MALLPSEILVFVDDGHGMETAGKRTPNYSDGTYIHENEFNHPTKILLMDSLKNQGIATYDVSPERTDTTLLLRVSRANALYKLGKFKAYIYISIHFNAIGSYWNDDVGGIETYYYPTSTTGKKLASYVHRYLIEGTDLKNRGIKSADFYVIRETSMTAILLELGFMSNHTEANLMRNVAYQNECATEITKGICDYFGLTYQEATDKLTKYTKIISPVYYEIWLKHFKANSSLNWEGFLESALKKTL